MQMLLKNVINNYIEATKSVMLTMFTLFQLCHLSVKFLNYFVSLCRSSTFSKLRATTSLLTVLY